MQGRSFFPLVAPPKVSYRPRGMYLAAGANHYQHIQFLMDEEALDKLPHLPLPNAYAPERQFVAALVTHSPRDGWAVERFVDYDDARLKWKKVRMVGAELWLKFFIIASSTDGGYVWRKAASWGHIRVNPSNALFVKDKFLNCLPDYGTRPNYASYDREGVKNLGAYRKLWELNRPDDSSRSPTARLRDPEPPRNGSIVSVRAWAAKTTFAVLVCENEAYWVVYEKKKGKVTRVPLGEWIDTQLDRPGSATRFKVSDDPDDFTTRRSRLASLVGRRGPVLKRRHPDDVARICHQAIAKDHNKDPKDFAFDAVFDTLLTDDDDDDDRTKNKQQTPSDKTPPADDRNIHRALSFALPAQ